MSNEWRKLETLPNVEVNENGQLRSIVNGKVRMLKARNNGKGYWNVNRNNRTYYVHRLVAEAFLGGPHPDLEVNHKDGNKANNRVSNLEWVTYESNRAHAIRTGLIGRSFTSEQDKVVWFMRDCGMALRDIAAQLKCSVTKITASLETRRPQ